MAIDLNIARLSPRARAVTRYLLSGWNPESIATALSISRIQVKQCVGQLRRCVRKPSTFEAVLHVLRTPAALETVMALEFNSQHERRGECTI